MANRVYQKFAEALMNKTYDMDTDDFRFMLIDKADETFNGEDEFVSDITSGGIVARMTASLTSKDITNGRFDAADPTINSVTGDTVEAIILYAYNASDAAARLATWADSPTFVFTPNGNNVTLIIDPRGVFQLTDIFP